MTIYVFGNPDVVIDSKPLEIATSTNIKGITWRFVKPNEDLPFDDEPHVVIMDTVQGLEKVTLFDESAIDNLALSPRVSAHDFDLNFQLKYLKKLGKLKRLTIIGIPMGKPIPQESIHSILRKLVAQDMQGS